MEWRFASAMFRKGAFKRPAAGDSQPLLWRF